LQRAIQTCATIILARILGPADFGLFALAFVAIDALGLFKSMGFDSALIQRKDNIEKAANTAFFIIPVLGIALYLILAISAPWIGKFLNNQQVVGVIRALGIIFVISCLGKVPAALMEKNMRFRQISIIEVTTAIIFSTTAVVLAILGMGVWSLVIGYILKTIYQNIMFFIYYKWRPKLEFDKKVALEMFNFGKFLFLGGVVWFLKMNLDNMLVGRLLGVTALGLYAIAFNIANFGADYFGGRVYRVIFPAFAKLQSDKYDLRQAFLKTTKLISIFAFPFCAILFLLGGELIRIVYGTKWIAAIPVLKVLAFAGLFNTLPIAMAPTFNATGNPKATFWAIFLQTLLFCVFVIPAIKLFGLVGVGAIVALSSIIVNIGYLPFTMRLASLRLSDIFSSISPGLISSLAFGLVILLIKSFFLKGLVFTGFIFYLNTFILIAISFLIYLFLLYRLDKAIVREIKLMLIGI